MSRSSTTQITIQSDPDGTGPAGSNLRWEAGSGTSVRASITITPNQQVNQIQTFVRQVGTNDAFAFYVDGVKVGTVTPPSGGAWDLRTIDLASPIAPGSHQLQIGPNATLANRANVDWFELHNTGSTPSPAQCGDGVDNDGDGQIDLSDPGCTSSTDTDETNPPTTPPAQCGDGVDNDGDGQIDLSDPGCTSSTDTDETNSTPPPTGTIVGSRLQAESMTESSSSISVQSDPDGSGPAGRNLRWASGATVSARASQSITVPTGSAVNQIQLFTRQASGEYVCLQWLRPMSMKPHYVMRAKLSRMPMHSTCKGASGKSGASISMIEQHPVH
jgi:hypothetical protein